MRGLPISFRSRRRAGSALQRVAHFAGEERAAGPARPDLGPGPAGLHVLLAQRDVDDVELLAAGIGAPRAGDDLLADLELEIEIGAPIAREADYGVEAATLGQPRSHLAKTR